jgi:hypothetical protein
VDHFPTGAPNRGIDPLGESGNRLSVSFGWFEVGSVRLSVVRHVSSFLTPEQTKDLSDVPARRFER